jgi:DNA-binding NtrC family response regulator
MELVPQPRLFMGGSCGELSWLLCFLSKATIRSACSESYLEEQGHEVLSAGTAAGALALLDKTSQIDLLFTDVDLKDEIAAGIELAQQAAQRKPNLKVLYTTDRSLTDGMKARFAKNSAFLAKPYTVEQLLTTLSVHFRIAPRQRREPVNA